MRIGRRKDADARPSHAILLRGAQPQIKRLIEMVGLHRLPGVFLEGPSPAFA